MIIVEITKEPVELYKILKFENMVSSGGQAKRVIANGLVLVNGQVESRKRKKIISGDSIEFADKKICIQVNLELAKAKTSVITEEVVSETAVVEPIVKKSKPKPRLNLSSKSIAKSAVKSGKSNRKSFQKLRSKVPVNK